MLAYMAGVLLCSLRVGRTLPRGGQGESGARATVPERDSAQWLHNYRLDSDHTCVDVHSRCYVVSRECMYMAWRALHSLVHYVDQAFARGRGLKRLERRPILLVVGKPGPSRQAHVKQVWDVVAQSVGGGQRKLDKWEFLLERPGPGYAPRYDQLGASGCLA